MEGVVVVGVVPVDHARRHIAFFKGGGECLDRLDRRLANLRVLGVQFTVGRDQALAAIGHQERLKEDTGVDPVGGQLVAVGAMISGTTPAVIAETAFWRIGANGMMLSSILLPLAVS